MKTKEQWILECDTIHVDNLTKQDFLTRLANAEDTGALTRTDASFIRQRFNLRYNAEFYAIDDHGITYQSYINSMISLACTHENPSGMDLFRNVLALGSAQTLIDSIGIMHRTLDMIYGVHGSSLVDLLYEVASNSGDLTPVEKIKYNKLLHDFASLGVLNLAQATLLRRP